MQFFYIDYMIYKALLAGMYCYMLSLFTLSYMRLHAFTSVYTKKQVLLGFQNPRVLAVSM